MKLQIKDIFPLVVLLTLANFVFAGGYIPPITGPGKIYVGIFGGGGSSNSFDVDQYGTVFFPEFVGGPLAVNAFGQVDHHSAQFIGGQIGYQAPEIILGINSQWSLAPAIELEGYSMSKSSFRSTLFNDTERLAEHDFDVTYPMERTVFLTNIIFTLNQPRFIVHPYIGFGIGSAIVNISNATSVQTDPPEAYINHYNANNNDTDTTFAGQIKLGLSYDIIKAITVFAEYRWLYLSSTEFTFGSTDYSIHAPTSSWEVELDPQKYNLGSLGIRLNL